MTSSRKAAINADELMSRPLGELNAVEFLRVLNHPRLRASGISLIADKKKYELWVEENELPRITVEELRDRMRTEKKKVEYELPDIIGPRVNPADLMSRLELDYGRLVEDIAMRVQEHMRNMR